MMKKEKSVDDGGKSPGLNRIRNVKAYFRMAK